jgi:Asp-tRNA(Asn)/Glu-tRNA(Gln) amidotransferase A subunit family amidase
LLADAVRTRRVSSRQLVERAFERISHLDGQLNSSLTGIGCVATPAAEQPTLWKTIAASG